MSTVSSGDVTTNSVNFSAPAHMLDHKKATEYIAMVKLAAKACHPVRVIPLEGGTEQDQAVVAAIKQAWIKQAECIAPLYNGSMCK